MKILFVITGLGLGGAEKVVVDLAEKMYSLGHSVKIAYLKGHPIVKPRTKEIELISLELEYFYNFYKSSKKYRRLVVDFKPDIVHAHMVHANIFTRLNRLNYSIPKLICTAHNSNEGGKLRMLAYKWTNKLSDFNTNVSQEATDCFIRSGAFDPTNICTIYNGIDLNRFKKLNIDKKQMRIDLGIPSDLPVVLAVGRLNQQKDYPNLLNALHQLIFKYKKECMVLIAGDGELKSSISELIIKLNLSRYVKLLGKRDDIPDLMSFSDLFVLSSAYEGFGLVVAEAMACECLVVATDCGGVKEVMGGNGILVPSKNDTELAKGLLEGLNIINKDVSSFKRNALEHIQSNFDLNIILEQWLDLYES